MSELEADRRPDPVQSVSETLVAARERLGLSQKEVADRLYLTTTFIGYIDDGEFDRLPKQAFVKGYLRSYAKVVGLSGDEMVAMYDEALNSAEPAPQIRGVTEEKVGTAAITGPVMQTGLIALILFLLVVGIIWVAVDRDEDKPPVRVTQPSVTQPSAERSNEDFDYVLSGQAEEQEAVNPGPPEPDEVTAVVEDDPSGEALNQEIEAAEASVESPAIQEVSIERTSNGSRSFIKVDAGGFDQLEISFPDECWVEIEDNARGLIYSDLNRAGEVLTVYGTAPFKLLLGKATGVEMLYNGRPFDLAPYVGQDSTAKVTVTE